MVAELDALRAEVQRLRSACSRENDTISQVLGRALGYPRFVDDQKSFPGSTDADGVCVGDHVAASLAYEAANSIRALRAEVERLRADARKFRELIKGVPLPPRAITYEGGWALLDRLQDAAVDAAMKGGES